ncbi:MAG: chemotaxis response regulator protein-glutamate methylesterase [Kordiimonadaceae bacterium]|nr:chemotaxis response regulator protein-glutamate methylesterase [Kordiimonadaceae bacterium]
MAAKLVKVLIVDDSALIRQILTAVMKSDPDIELVGTAEDPLVARRMIKKLNPDVITLDIEMPNMDGLSFLEKIMALRPMPVIMISSLTQRGAEQTMRALELGAYDIIAKPTANLEHNFEELRTEILSKVKAAAKARICRPAHLGRKITQTRIAMPKVNLIAVGASTGGVVALKEIIPLLPRGMPPIVVVQHMPPAYTKSFAERLDLASTLNVQESAHHTKLERSNVYIAHGDIQLRVGRRGNSEILLEHGCEDKISGHRPSVDALFMSITSLGVRNVVGLILTGMGKDGATGMLALRQAGAYTIGQCETSCVVYGMPRAAQEIDAVEIELPLSKIAKELETLCWPTGLNKP